MFVLTLTSLSRLAIYISGRGGQGGLRHLHLQGALRPSTYKISIVVMISLCAARKGLSESIINIYSGDEGCICFVFSV